MDTIISQMNLLSLSDDPLPMLANIKSNLIAISNQDLLATTFEIDGNLLLIGPLFDFLNTNNNEQILLSIDILGYILSKVKPQLSFECFYNNYNLCLNHPHDKVRLCALKQIHLCAEGRTTSEMLLKEQNLILKVFNNLSDSNLEIVKISQEIIIKLCQHPGIVSQIFNQPVSEILHAVSSKSESCRFHVFDLGVKISSLGEDCLKVISSLGLLNHLVNEVFSGDVLTQLNALQLLSELTTQSTAFSLLKTEGIFTKLTYLLSTAKSDPMAAVLLPGVMKFFGNLGAAQPQILVEEESAALREIMKMSCDFNLDAEPSIQLIAFETLCHIGSNVEGKLALQKFGVETEQSLRDVFSHMSAFPTDMKVRVLESLAKLFYLHPSEQSEDLVQLLENWFGNISEDSPMSKISNLAKQPFPEILIGSLSIMHSLCQYEWGLTLMKEEAGLMEWLLCRDTCKDKTSKNLRFSIITSIRNLNVSIKSILGEEIINNIELFYSQGPYYIETESCVAVEKQT